jgi:hypothetical protein
MKLILEIPNSILKTFYVKKSFLIIFKLLIEGFKIIHSRNLFNISLIPFRIQPFQF